MSLRNLPSGGSPTWDPPVVNPGDLPSVGNQDGDIRLVTSTSSLYYWNENTSSWNILVNGIGSSINTEKFTLVPADITNKYITIANAPTNSNLTRVMIIGGGEQDYSTDFTVIGTQINWNSLGLDGVLASGDKVIITYD